jgi:hypothetical protein
MTDEELEREVEETAAILLDRGVWVSAQPWRKKRMRVEGAAHFFGVSAGHLRNARCSSKNLYHSLPYESDRGGVFYNLAKCIKFAHSLREGIDDAA